MAERGPVENSPSTIVCNVDTIILIVFDLTCIDKDISCNQKFINSKPGLKFHVRSIYQTFFLTGMKIFRTIMKRVKITKVNIINSYYKFKFIL